ncbi:MAG: SRPBCC family protein [Acidimicrobiales bacterium]|nr:SRPBCC family protein [Acidimicrobiales bacterium]
MTEIRTAVTIAAPPAAVWADVRDIASHVEWMADAVEIRFTSDTTDGTGTTFECDTRVGPLRLTDLMEITEWEDDRRMGVRHVGLVTGTGVFTLEPLDEVATVFTWTERLQFPWWLGGPLGAAASRPVMRWIWRRNLARLKARIEGAAGGGDHPVQHDQPNA